MTSTINIKYSFENNIIYSFKNLSLGATNQSNGDMTTKVYKPTYTSTSSISGDYSSVSGQPSSCYRSRLTTFEELYPNRK